MVKKWIAVIHNKKEAVVKIVQRRKDIVLVMSGQLGHKVVLESLGTKTQIENDHAGRE